MYELHWHDLRISLFDPFSRDSKVYAVVALKEGSDIEFKCSKRSQTTEVQCGWDRLLLSVVSVGGKGQIEAASSCTPPASPSRASLVVEIPLE